MAVGREGREKRFNGDYLKWLMSRFLELHELQDRDLTRKFEKLFMTVLDSDNWEGQGDWNQWNGPTFFGIENIWSDISGFVRPVPYKRDVDVDSPLRRFEDRNRGSMHYSASQKSSNRVEPRAEKVNVQQTPLGFLYGEDSVIMRTAPLKVTYDNEKKVADRRDRSPLLRNGGLGSPLMRESTKESHWQGRTQKPDRNQPLTRESNTLGFGDSHQPERGDSPLLRKKPSFLQKRGNQPPVSSDLKNRLSGLGRQEDTQDTNFSKNSLAHSHYSNIGHATPTPGIQLQNRQNPGDQDINSPLKRPKVQALPIKAPNFGGQNLTGRSANPLMSEVNWDSTPNKRENPKFTLNTSQYHRAAHPRYSQNRGSAILHGESREMTPNPLLGRHSVDRLLMGPPKSVPVFSPTFTPISDHNLSTKAAYKPSYPQNHELSTSQTFSNARQRHASQTNTDNHSPKPSIEILNSSKPMIDENQSFQMPMRPT
jgi:hypothetical protein